METIKPKNAREAGFKRITVAELQTADLFSLDGKAFFIFSSVEQIGAELVSIHYLSTKKWRSYDKIIRSNRKVYVAPFGRHYEG